MEDADFTHDVQNCPAYVNPVLLQAMQTFRCVSNGMKWTLAHVHDVPFWAIRSTRTFPQRLALKRECHRLKLELSSVYRKLNALTNPGRLPPELLAEIFSHLEPYDSDLEWRYSSFGALIASHVCQYWREVALEGFEERLRTDFY